MTIQHAIVAFPRFEAADEIERVRREFDPLAAIIDAHVTLVFPFECALPSEQLRDHLLAAIEGVVPFAITLTAPTAGNEGYLFLNVLEGSQHLSGLHRRLYSGPLGNHRSQSHSYEPHVTVGRLATPEQLQVAAQRAGALISSPLRGRVESVALFRLADGNGVIDFTVPLALP